MQPLVDELGRDRAYLGTLAADSSNIVDLVEEIYYVSPPVDWLTFYTRNNVEFLQQNELQRISQRIVFAPEIVPGLSIKVTPTECPGRWALLLVAS